VATDYTDFLQKITQIDNFLILRRHQTPAFRAGSEAPLSINPEPSAQAQAEDKLRALDRG
jgi:hypothetical protein